MRTEFEETAEAQNTLMFRWSKPIEARDVARAGFQGMQRGRGVASLHGRLGNTTTLTLARMH
jgi:hypothetical protein